MKNPQDFFIEKNNKYIDFDQVFGCQCVDLIKAYMSECLNLPTVKGNAIDYWNNPPEGFTKESEPKVWDLAVFDYKPVGHIIVLNWVTKTEVNGLSQNDPLGSPCVFKTYPRDSHILGYLRPPASSLPTDVPRPSSQVPSTSKFTLGYTAINSDPSLLEQARQLLVQYSGGRIDCSFQYSQLPPIYPLNGKIFSREEQIQFIHNFPIPTRYGFVSYMCSIPNYFQMTTAEVSQTPNIVTFATLSNKDPMYFCYEFVNALEAQALSKGIVIPGNNDVFTPSEDFIKAKLTSLLPFISKLS